MNGREWKRWFYYFSLGTILIIIFKTIDSVSAIYNGFANLIKIMMPFVLAIIVAYILYLPGRGIEKAFEKTKINFLIKHKRKISIFVVYLVLILILFMVFTFLIPSVSKSLKELVSNVPKYITMLNEYLNNVEDNSIIGELGFKSYFEKISNVNITDQAVKWLNYDNAFKYLKNIVGGAGLIFDAIVTLIVSVYVLSERDSIKKFLSDVAYAVFDEKGYEVCIKYSRRLNTIFCGFISGQVIDAFIVGVISAIVMSLMNVKYAVLLGVLIGVLNIIPYFGAIFGVLFAIIITIFTGGFSQALIMAIVIIVLQQIDANIINARIIGNSLHISPILVIFAVTIGGAYFGALGMFLGVPILTMIKEIVLDFINYRNRVKIAKFEDQLIEEFSIENVDNITIDETQSEEKTDNN